MMLARTMFWRLGGLCDLEKCITLLSVLNIMKNTQWFQHKMLASVIFQADFEVRAETKN